MKRQRMMSSALAVLVIGTILAAFAPSSRADQLPDLPTFDPAVNKVISPENLKAIAAKSSDAEVLLGLTYLAGPDKAVRGEIAEMVVKAKPDYAPIVAVLAVRTDAADEKTVAELIKSDAGNAYGYYLQGKLLYGAGKEKEALAAFRQATTCLELRLYENTTGPALFKALDALGLHGRDRVCALSYVASQAIDSDVRVWPDVVSALTELTNDADLETRKETSEILLLLAGHLYTTNFQNRWSADEALEHSFRYKAELAAAEKSPAMNGYAAVTKALISVQQAINQPGFLEISTLSRGTVMYLPSHIHRTFYELNRPKGSFESEFKLPESDKAAFEKAEANQVGADRALIELAAAAPDEIVGAYIKGLPPPRKNASFPWVSLITYVDRVVLTQPYLVKAAAACEEAGHAMQDAEKNDLRLKNMGRMMDIGMGIIGYAQDHKNMFPENLSVLFEKKYLAPAVESKSLLSGRAYVYVAAGEKSPEKSAEIGKFIVLYDDDMSDGCYCLFADGHISRQPVDKVRDQLRKQGKQGP